MEFKEAMSRMANTVCVLSVRNSDDRIHACTISSMVSLSVVQDNEMLIFVLKKDSKIGRQIKNLHNFSICILSEGQGTYASEYSNLRDDEFVSESKWIPFRTDFVYLRDAKVFFACRFHKCIEDYSSDIYVAHVITQQILNNNSCLIYENRNYGSLRHDDH